MSEDYTTEVERQISATRPFLFVNKKVWSKYKVQVQSLISNDYVLLDTPVKTGDIVVFARLKVE